MRKLGKLKSPRTVHLTMETTTVAMEVVAEADEVDVVLKPTVLATTDATKGGTAIKSTQRSRHKICQTHPTTPIDRTVVATNVVAMAKEKVVKEMMIVSLKVLIRVLPQNELLKPVPRPSR